MSQRTIIGRFYDDLWTQGHEQLAHELCHPDFEFVGSLGSRRRGPDEFLEYVRYVRGALGDYRCTVEDLVEEGSRVFAKARFEGRHDAEFEGVPATGRHVSWTGAALFDFEAGRIRSLWVLGDRLELYRQLGMEWTPCST